MSRRTICETDKSRSFARCFKSRAMFGGIEMFTDTFLLLMVAIVC